MIEQEFKIPVRADHKDLLKYISEQALKKARTGIPLRFVITKTDNKYYHCEISVLISDPSSNYGSESIFNFQKRESENTEKFNAVLVIPTGIGSELGGHAGDAGSVSRLMASVCDNLILHPNVVNASDINEMTENTLYVEGSVLTKLLMGTAGLQKVRSNRVLAIIDDHEKDIFPNAAINSINAARATYGLDCPEIIKMNPPIEMEAEYSSSGMASGKIQGIQRLFELIDDYRDNYDAIALSSVIQVPYSYHLNYFTSKGEMINPWGGVEAMLTHAISHIYNLPSAHSPMFETEGISNLDPGIVDSRMAAEAVSMTFLQCILKGLQRSPKIITDKETMTRKGVLTSEDVSCLIIPDGCLGLPTLAALEQGIPVIAVMDKNIMQNDLNTLPWNPNQFHQVNNYLEAAGVITAMKAGVSIESIIRPLELAKVVNKSIKQNEESSQSKSA